MGTIIEKDKIITVVNIFHVLLWYNLNCYPQIMLCIR